jgi:integrase
VAAREPFAAEQCAAVLRIPTKRAARRSITYLDPEEVATILAQPDRKTLTGQRDHVLLALLYNTGARIQEALALTPSAVRLDAAAQVRFMGKGRKERICPLWPETAALIGSRAVLVARTSRSSPTALANRSTPRGRVFGSVSTYPGPSGYIRTCAISTSHRTPSGTRQRFTSSPRAST